MWILLLLIPAVLFILIYRKQQRSDNNEINQRFKQVFELLAVIDSIRQHRAATHQQLKGHQEQAIERARWGQKMLEEARELSMDAPSNQKSMYRIFHKNLTELNQNWLTYSIARNQSIHGKAIRHAFYMIDELVCQALAIAELDDELKHYERLWQLTVDGLDTLTHFRTSIDRQLQHNGAPNNYLAIQANLLHRRISQIVILTRSDAMLNTPFMVELQALSQASQQKKYDEENLYVLSSIISESIIVLFCTELNALCKRIAIETPESASLESQHTSF